MQLITDNQRVHIYQTRMGSFEILLEVSNSSVGHQLDNLFNIFLIYLAARLSLDIYRRKVQTQKENIQDLLSIIKSDIPEIPKQYRKAIAEKLIQLVDDFGKIRIFKNLSLKDLTRVFNFFKFGTTRIELPSTNDSNNSDADPDDTE